MTDSPTGRDGLGDRMKAAERVTRTQLPPRTYTVIRADGKAFHSYTRGLDRPFDATFAEDMDAAALALAGEVAGAFLVYVQSDEISVCAQDFATPTTQPWFGGQVQKITSVAASVATAALNARRQQTTGKLAYFDARVFTLPDVDDVEAYLIWRQRDAVRNSVSMAAQAHFSHKRLQGLSSGQCQELLFTEAGVNWNDYPDAFKWGRVLVRETATEPVTFTRRDSGETITTLCERTRWVCQAAPRFTPGGWLREHIPVRSALPSRATA